MAHTVRSLVEQAAGLGFSEGYEEGKRQGYNQRADENRQLEAYSKLRREIGPDIAALEAKPADTVSARREPPQGFLIAIAEQKRGMLERLLIDVLNDSSGRNVSFALNPEERALLEDIRAQCKA